MALTKEQKAKKKMEDKAAAELIATLTQKQLDDLGMQFGMSNMGQNPNARPETYAETDEEYGYFMDEINHWRKLLRNPKEKWGCFYPNDLIERVQVARKRQPYNHQQLCKLLNLAEETPKEMVQDLAKERGFIPEIKVKQDRW